MSEQLDQDAIKKKIFTISPSSANMIESCGYLFGKIKVERYSPIKTAAPLDRGSLGHFMMHPFYFGRIRNIKDHHMKHPFRRLLNLDRADLIKASAEIGRLYSLTTDLDPEDREETIEKFVNYCNYYDDDFEVLEVEQPLVRVLEETDDYIIVFECISDLITHDRKLNQVIPYDHKFTGRDYKIAKTDHQITGTCWALDVPEFRINKILDRKEKPFTREPYSYDPEQLEEWRRDIIKTAILGINYIEANYFPRMRNSCSEYCPMYKACSVIPSSRNGVLGSQFKKGDEYTPKFDIFKRDADKIEKIMKLIFGELESDEQQP